MFWSSDYNYQNRYNGILGALSRLACVYIETNEAIRNMLSKVYSVNSLTETTNSYVTP